MNDETLTLVVPDELVERVAQRAAQIVAERNSRTGTDRWFRGARQIADYIGAPTSRVYALSAHAPPQIPVSHDGSALIAKQSDLDVWLENGGGKRV